MFPHTEKGNQVVNQSILKWADPGSQGGPRVITDPNTVRGEEGLSQGAGLDQGGRSQRLRSQKRLGNEFSLEEPPGGIGPVTPDSSPGRRCWTFDLQT